MRHGFSVQKMTITAMFAVIAILTSLISIPMPGGVPLTLQTFGLALIGYVLGPAGIWSVLVWLFLGLVGLPVFAGFQGGLQVLAGFTGGFILGFPFMSLLCGIGSKRHSVLSAFILGLAGLSVPHLLGILHYCGLTGLSFASSALVMSVPYLVKDVLSVGLAMSLGRMLRRRIAPLTLL